MSSLFGVTELPILIPQSIAGATAELRRAVPLFDTKCPAGFPSPAADYAESALDFNEYLVKHPASTFVFTVVGDSMTGAGIYSGDKIVVDRSLAPEHGSIVVAILHGEHTVKRLHLANGLVELQAENPQYAPIRLKEAEELLIFGVVVGVVRKVRR